LLYDAPFSHNTYITDDDGETDATLQHMRDRAKYGWLIMYTDYLAASWPE